MEAREYEKMFKLEDEHWWFRAKRGFISVLIKSFLKRKDNKILDVGCGTGRNLQLLKSWGKVYGVDAEKRAIEFCRRRGLKQVDPGSASKLPYPNKHFELVTIFDVLYHRGIADDSKALREANRVLKTGGLLLITDCAHPFLYGPHDEAMHARERYKKAELEKKVKKAGFKIKRSSYIFFLTFPIFLISRLWSKFFNTGKHSAVDRVNPAMNVLLTKVCKIEANFLKAFNLPLGSSIIILAQK